MMPKLEKGAAWQVDWCARLGAGAAQA
jgi:hypothetical protein